MDTYPETWYSSLPTTLIKPHGLPLAKSLSHALLPFYSQSFSLTPNLVNGLYY